jgi:hypothetical protein
MKGFLHIYIEKNTTEPEIKKYSVVLSEMYLNEAMERKRAFFTNTPTTFIGNTTPLQPNIQSLLITFSVLLTSPKLYIDWGKRWRGKGEK